MDAILASEPRFGNKAKSFNLVSRPIRSIISVSCVTLLQVAACASTFMSMLLLSPCTIRKAEWILSYRIIRIFTGNCAKILLSYRWGRRLIDMVQFHCIQCHSQLEHQMQRAVAAPAFFSEEAKGGGKTFLGGQVYMVANNALRQYGTHTPLFQLSFPPFPFISLFSLLPVIPFLSTSLSFQFPAPPLLWYSCELPYSGSGQSPAANCNLVNSGPRNERFLTCQSGKFCSSRAKVEKCNGKYFMVKNGGVFVLAV